MTDQENYFTNLPPEEPKVRGRPMIPLDEDLIRTFLEEGTPVKEIADYFNVTTQTIYNRFGNLVHQMNVLFKFEMRQKQNELARNGDRGMLIHIGKTILGQAEAMPVEVEPGAKDEGIAWSIEPPTVEHKQTMTESEREEVEGDED